ncbi:hypothetical protein ACFLSQ_04180 [Bacteroidota bacterium]
MKKHLIFLLLIICILFLGMNNSNSSQLKKYKVIISKGDVFKKNDNGLKKITTGNIITPNDSIIADGDYYLLLKGFSGDFIELNNPGRFVLKNIPGENRFVDTAFIEGYLNYIVNAIKESDDEIKGFVAGKEKDIPGDKQVDIFFPRTTKVIDQTLHFFWKSNSSISNYIFRLKSEDNTIILSKMVSDTTFTLDASKYDLLTNVCYFWDIYDFKNPSTCSESYCIFYLSQDEIKQIGKDMNRFKNCSGKPEGPLRLLMFANYYEKKGLMLNAFKYYSVVLQKYPDVPEFKKLYNLFLMKNGVINKYFYK